jgi:tetratricopeptide (TPR) repeat protein
MKLNPVPCIALVLALLSACHSKPAREAEVAPPDKSILHQMPFAGITDSIDRDQDNTTLLLRRGDLLTQFGQHELAYTDYRKAWEQQPSEALAISLSNNLFTQGRTEVALQFIREALKLYPSSEHLRRRLGEAYTQTGQSGEAMKVYNELLGKDSSNFEAWFDKALLYMKTKDTAEAIRCLRRSYELQPLQLTGLSLANLYAELKYPEAIRICDEVIEKDSAGELIDPYFIKGIYYSNTHNFPKALDMYNKCIRIDWKFNEAYIEKGIIYFDQKNLDEALKQFKMAAQVSNSYADAYYWQGRCYEELGRTEEALTNYARAYALDPGFGEAVEAAARIREKEGKSN